MVTQKRDHATRGYNGKKGNAMKLVRLAMIAAAVMLVGASAWPAFGAGMLVPKDTDLPPLAVKYLRVDATIDNQAATTRVTQEFLNSTDRQLECTYIFPLPKGAAIREFAMYIGGVRQVGELVEKEKARQVFEEIVRRAKDPGLLEYIDATLLRMRVFPVPAKGTQKIEIEYTEVLPAEGGLCEYVFPLKAGEKASRTLDDFTVAVKIKSTAGIASVYSPTHEVGISRKSDHEVVTGMEQKAAVLDRDFHLIYGLSDKDFGLSLMTYRPDASKPGMFMILLAPKTEMDASRNVPRDVAFVVDTSGSMAGEKIQQVRKALEFCLGKLDAKDRFAIIQFSTSTDTLSGGWLSASEENLKKARTFTEKLEAAGGTNIGEALDKALALPQEEGRLTTILFLTDGRPTVGTTDQDTLTKAVKDHNKQSLRVFTFGVGDDVNTHLLDKIAGDTGGLPEYVRQGDTIDLKVVRLFSKMSHPVLTDLGIEMPGIKIVDMYPKQPPDLFRGGQVVLIGSYEGDGHSAIRLKGRTGKKAEEFVYEGTFPKETSDRGFIGPLYAQRKIGYLLDQIRLHGEEKELKDEVVRLSLAYGIETPYTSYLVLENKDQYKQYGITRREDEMKAKTPGVVAGAGEKAAERVQAEFDKSINSNTSGLTINNGGALASGATKISGGTLTLSSTGATAINNGIVRRFTENPIPSTDGSDPSLEVLGVGGGGARSGAPAGPKSATTPPPATKPDTTITLGAGSGHIGGHEGLGTSHGAVDALTDTETSTITLTKVAGVHASADELKKENTGKAGVDIAEQVKSLREASNAKDLQGALAVQVKGKQRFLNFRGVWVDERFQGTEKLLKIKWGSEAYFRLAREKPELREAFTLGQRLIVVTAKGQAVAVDADEGAETMTDDVFKALFVDAATEPPAKTAEEKPTK
jgi:Ca-activated chloride channel homolog